MNIKRLSPVLVLAVAVMLLTSRSALLFPQEPEAKIVWWWVLPPTETPATRSGHEIVALDDESFLLCGGTHHDTYKIDNWIYNAKSRRWLNNGHSPGMRYFPVVNCNGRILYQEGMTLYDNLGSLCEYNREANTWGGIVSLPKDGVSPPTLYGQRMVFDGTGAIILFGGINDEKGEFYSNQTWAFDMRKNAWNELNPSVRPEGRAFFGMAADGGNTAVVFGGWDGKKHLNDTWLLNMKALTWRKLEMAVAPEPRSSLQLQALGKDRFLLFGGNDKETVFGDTWILDLKAGVWRKLATKTSPPERTKHAMTTVGGAVIMCGGYNDFLTELNDVWRFDDSAPDWIPLSQPVSAEYMTGCQLVPSGDLAYLCWGYAMPRGFGQLEWRLHLPTGRWEEVRPVEKNKRVKRRTGSVMVVRGAHPSACRALAIGNGQILFLGELDETSKKGSPVMLDSAAVYNPADNTLTFRYFDRGPVHKSGYAAAFDGADGVYCFGGVDDYETGKPPVYYNDMWRYDVIANRWEEISQAHPPAEREGHSLVPTASGTLILFGGADKTGRVKNDLWEFDLGKKAWREIAGADRPPARKDHGLVRLDSGKLVLFGGLDAEGRFLNDTWLFDRKSGAWKNVTGPIAPFGRSNFGMAAVGGNRVILYGISGYRQTDDFSGYYAKRDSGDVWIADFSKF